MTGAGGAGASDTDVFDDLRLIATVARSRAGETGPIREGLDPRIARVEAALQAFERIREICTEEEPEKPGELDGLNPYKRGSVDNPTPTEQPARFLHGVRYYLGMLEDGDSWGHSLGHIEELCRELQAAINALAGRATEPPDYDELRAALAYLWGFVERSQHREHFEAANAHNRIALALFAKRSAEHPSDELAADLVGLRDGLREIRDALLDGTGWNAARVTVDSLGPRLDRITTALGRGGK